MHVPPPRHKHYEMCREGLVRTLPYALSVSSAVNLESRKLQGANGWIFELSVKHRVPWSLASEKSREEFRISTSDIKSALEHANG